MSVLILIIKPLAYLSLPLILVRTIAASTKGRYYLRLGAYIGCITLVATWGAFAAAVLTIIGRRYNINLVIARTFYAVAGSMLDIQIEIEGKEHLATRPAVLVSNHQSMLDILFLGRVIPDRTSMMAKQSLKYSPLGPFMMMAGTVFIDRSNNKTAVKSINAAGKKMKTVGLSLWMFPEGTRHLSEYPDLLPFKKGGFHLAIQSGIPIIPIVFENYWRLYHPGVFASGLLKVKVLPPVPTEELTEEDATNLAVKVRDQMTQALREISVKVPAPAVKGAPVPSSDIHPKPEDSSADVPVFDEQMPPSPAPGSSQSLPSIISLDSPRRRSESSARSSETSGETEEDEGMVLVGRPT